MKIKFHWLRHNVHQNSVIPLDAAYIAPELYAYNWLRQSLNQNTRFPLVASCSASGLQNISTGSKILCTSTNNFLWLHHATHQDLFHYEFGCFLSTTIQQTLDFVILSRNN